MTSQLDLESEKSILTRDNNENQEYQDVPVHELSGDENAEKSVLLSEIQTKRANFFLTTMTIMKTVIGVGILGLPNVMKNLGWVLGTLIFLATSFLNQYSCTILLKVKNLSHHSNYSTIGYYIFKSKWFQAYTYFLILFNNFGVCLAELTIFKQTFEMIIMEFWKELQPNWYFQPWFVTGICLSIILIPFTLVSKIQKLKYLALLGITAISCFIICLIINFIKLFHEEGKLPGINLQPFPTNATDAISSVPNILLAFLYQMNFFPIYKGLEGSTDKKMLNASLVGTVSCFVIYTATGLMGYFSYGIGVISSNFLQSLHREKTGTALYVMMTSIFLLSVLCSFPLIFYGARNNFIALYKVLRSSSNSGNEGQLRHADSIVEISEYVVSESKKKKKLIAKIIFYVMTFILFAIIMVVAITVGELGKTFNIVGAVASNSIGFILPGLFYFMLVYKKRNLEPSTFTQQQLCFVLLYLLEFSQLSASFSDIQQSMKQSFYLDIYARNNFITTYVIFKQRVDKVIETIDFNFLFRQYKNNIKLKFIQQPNQFIKIHYMSTHLRFHEPMRSLPLRSRTLRFSSIKQLSKNRTTLFPSPEKSEQKPNSNITQFVFNEAKKKVQITRIIDDYFNDQITCSDVKQHKSLSLTQFSKTGVHLSRRRASLKVKLNAQIDFTELGDDSSLNTTTLPPIEKQSMILPPIFQQQPETPSKFNALLIKTFRKTPFQSRSQRTVKSKSKLVKKMQLHNKFTLILEKNNAIKSYTGQGTDFLYLEMRAYHIIKSLNVEPMYLYEGGNTLNYKIFCPLRKLIYHLSEQIINSEAAFLITPLPFYFQLLNNNNELILQIIKSVLTTLKNVEGRVINFNINLLNVHYYKQKLMIDSWATSALKQPKINRNIGPVLRNKDQWFVSVQHLPPEMLQSVIYGTEYDMFEHPSSIDIWSLGSLILQLITLIPLHAQHKFMLSHNRRIVRRGLYTGRSNNVENLIIKQKKLCGKLRMQLEKLGEIPSNLNPKVLQLLTKMLKLNPSQRLTPQQGLKIIG